MTNVDAPGNQLPPGEHRYVPVDQYERTLRPELLDEYANAGYCWVVIGSLQAGRAFAQPKIAPSAIAYYAQLAKHGGSCSTSGRLAQVRAPSRSTSTGRSTTTRASIASRSRDERVPAHRGARQRCTAAEPAPAERLGSPRILSERCPLRPIPIAATSLARSSSPSTVVVGSAPTRWSARSSADARASSARVTTASSAARTPRSRRSARPGTARSTGRRCMSRSSRAAIRAGRRRAPTRSAPPASRASSSASDDPSEHASGRGLGILRDEGIEVVLADGELAARARLLNQPFRKHARTGRPWVLFKSAMTLDGKVATRSGDSKWISGEASRRLAHHLARRVRRRRGRDRHRARRRSAADRPRRRRHRASRGGWCSTRSARLPLDAQLVRDARQMPLTVVVSRAAPRAATDALETHGVEVIVATGENEPARVCSALDQLGAAGVASILLEGGPHLAGAFLDAGEIDEIRLFLAPLVLGGRTARDPLEGEGVEQIADAVRALTLDCERDRRGPARLRPHQGVVSACSPG